MVTIKILLAAIFVVTGGAVFSERYRKHGILAVLASIVSIAGAFYLIRDIKNDIVVEVEETISTKGTATVDDANRCENSYLIVTKNDPQCGFGLNGKSELLYNGKVVEGALAVSYSSDGEVTPAKLFVVYPQSNSRRFALIQTCEFQENHQGYGLCWSPFILDKKKRQLHKTHAGKYGPERWIEWAADDKYAILYNSNEGANWVHAVETNTGKTFEFPPYNPSSTDIYQMTKVHRDTFMWRGPRTFEIEFSFERLDSKSWELISKGDSVWRLDITPKGLLGGPL